MSESRKFKRQSTWFVICVMLMMGASLALIIGMQRVSTASQSRVSLSVRQKTLIDDIHKTLLLAHLKVEKTPGSESYTARLKLNFSKWEDAQRVLVNGGGLYGIDGNNSEEVQQLFYLITPGFIKLRDQLIPLINGAQTLSVAQLPELDTAVENYVSGMTDLIGQYTKEGLHAFQLMRILSIVLIVFSIFFFFPLYRWLLTPAFLKIENAENKIGSLDEELKQAKRAKTDFLANMSHEIRTPLNGVIGMTELMAKTNLDNEQHEFIRNIHSSALNLLDVVNDILDVSQLESGKLELNKSRFILSDCIDQVIDLMKPLANAKRLELINDIDMHIPVEIRQDERRLRQVLLSLINNAIKFTENGEILIRAELINRESDFIQIKFSVSDTGIGIEQEKMETLFDSFSQVDTGIRKKYGGAGLGLTISKSLVIEMGGRIWVESKPMKGSTFFFTIVAETGTDSQQSKIGALNGLKALVIDDNKTNLKILVRQLSAWGVQATPFNSPDLVNEIAANLHKFDFCLMDMQMPEMDGRILAEKIREKHDHKRLPIIALSSMGQHLIDGKGNLYNAYLTKPVRQAKLLDTLIEVLHLNPESEIKNHIGYGKHEMSFSQNSLKVLIAQDNELTRAVTAKTLQLLGHKYEIASNSQQILTQMQKGIYDLIIMDVNEPELNGVDTVKKMKKNSGRNELPVIIGLTEDEDRDKKICLQAGIDDLIPKPMNPELLSSKIHYWFEEGD